MHPIRLAVLATLSSSIALVYGLSPALAERLDATATMEFSVGSSVKRLSGAIKGGQRTHYRFTGKAGQALSLGITASVCHTFFSISLPDEGTDLFIGEQSGILFEGTLPKTGSYLVTVYLAQEPAREGAISNYNLTIQDLGQPGSRPISREFKQSELK